MANVNEVEKWEPGIYQLETTDPVMGGEDGIDNLQARQLANRTVYLKKIVETPATTTQSGRVKLNSSVNSISETEAATPLAVKRAYDLASTANKNSQNMKIKLNSSVDSTSETESATPLAVKKVNDLATQNQKKLSNVIDKFTSNNNESIVLSPNHNYHIVMRNDGVCGVYNHLTNKFSWFIDNSGGIDGYIGCDRVVGLEQFVKNQLLPVGIPQPWPTTTPPDGWLKCNGWKFDKNKYPKLAQVYPSGYLPDLRGEFIRGWDDGKGTDPGRGILSWQQDAIRNIYGEFAGLQQHSSGVFNYVEKGAAYAALTNNTWDKAIYAFNASNVVPTSHDNHPRNLAFMYILKAE